MPNKFLVRARIVPVYNLDEITYRKAIVIYLSTKTIWLYPFRGGLRKIKNKKYSLRRLMRWGLRGCHRNIRGPEYISPHYSTVILTREDLERMLSLISYKEKEGLIREIENEVNTGKCS